MSKYDASKFIQMHIDAFNKHRNNLEDFGKDNPFSLDGYDNWAPDIYDIGIAPWTGDF